MKPKLQTQEHIPRNPRASMPSEYKMALTEVQPTRLMSHFRNFDKNSKQLGRTLHVYKDSLGTESTQTHISPIKYTIDPKVNARVSIIVNQVSQIKRKHKAKHRKSYSSIPKPIIKKTKKISLDPLIQNIALSKRRKTRGKSKRISLAIVNKGMQQSFDCKSKKIFVTPMRKMPNIFTPTQMNNKVIRDFGLQSHASRTHIEYSKKNMELTQNYLERRHDIMRNNTRNVISTFEKLKEKTLQGHSIEESYLDFDIFEEFNQRKNREEYKKIKNKQETKIAEEIDTKAHKYADLVLQVNSKKYMNNENKETPSEIKINYNNLRKKIMLHNFREAKHEMEFENEIFDSVEKLKREKNETDAQLLLALKELGPPHFVKNKFSNNTVKKFNGITGLYLGLPG